MGEGPKDAEGPVMSDRDRIARLEALVDRLVSTQPKAKALTQTQFAAQTGLSRSTVFRRIKQRKIRTEQGRIPADQLSKFLS